MGKKCISIVVPMYNEQESLQILYRELNRVTREMGDYDFEYLFVNDGSKDATLQKIRELAAEDERVHYLSFSRNFGKEAALLSDLTGGVHLHRIRCAGAQTFERICAALDRLGMIYHGET